MKTEIQKTLFSMQDTGYRKFHAGLMPGVEFEKIIGVRVPDVRKIAKKLDEAECRKFIKVLPHRYYEENNLHAFLIERIKEYDRCIEETEKFLPFIDNWATCDSLRPKCFEKNKEKLILKINEWIMSEHEYTVRFAIEMLMVYFLDEDFESRYLEKVASVKSDKYYVNMMIAWFFATALAKQYDSAVNYLREGTLSEWVHNKTIQKAIESYRIPNDKKDYLKKLKREVSKNNNTSDTASI